MKTKMTDRIMERPKRLDGVVAQARYVPSYHITEEEIREITLHFEERLSTISISADVLTGAEKFLLRRLQTIYDCGTFHEFVEDFDKTQLGMFFKRWEEKGERYELVQKALDVVQEHTEKVLGETFYPAPFESVLYEMPLDELRSRVEGGVSAINSLLARSR